MKPRTWLLTAGFRRVLVETGLVTADLSALLLLVAGEIPDPDSRSTFIGLGGVAVGLVVAPLGALRLSPRRRDGSRRRRIGHEVASAAILLGAALALSWLVIRTVTARLMPPAIDGGIDPVTAGLVYAVWRGALIGWPAWNRLRRARLLWALTHAQMIAAMGLAAIVTLLLTLDRLRAAGPRPPISPDANGGAALVAWGAILLILATNILLILILAASVIVIPTATLISLPVLRRATRRLEDLAAATAALRTGALGTRVPVAGEDEVARLQADFNAMAADLERTLGELATERDHVASLLQARRELVASVSHELRTPVATLRGYLESMLDRWDERPPSALRDDLAVMARETEHLQRLIDDLFTLSRVEVGGLPLRLDAVDVGALLRRCAEAAAGLAWERGRVEVLADVAPGLPFARADAARLEQVVRNLVANAVRHTPPGGLVLLGAEQDGHAVVVQVKDTGEGIPAEDLPHIWERFYRGGARSATHGGAGLGLALVKELAEAMGGSVAVESLVGQGSCFTIRLPAACAADPAHLPAS